VFELELTEADEAAARERVQQMCEQLLANTVIENYDIEIG
jgi:phosphoribosylformylglycinamidine synthase